MKTSMSSVMSAFNALQQSWQITAGRIGSDDSFGVIALVAPRKGKMV
jgi:hypothetical protein